MFNIDRFSAVILISRCSSTCDYWAAKMPPKSICLIRQSDRRTALTSAALFHDKYSPKKC